MSSSATISHEIADTLRTEILSQRFRSGERLPSERDLAARFAASRGAVREALSQLEQIGLISIQPGGVRVKALEDASISILGPLLALNKQPDIALVDQFLQTFAALSALNAREALTLANDEQIKVIRQHIATLRKHGSEMDSAKQLWVEFLEYLADVADNLVLRLISNDLKAQFVDRMMREQVKPVLKKRVLQEIFRELENALEEGDRNRFGNAVLRYFDELRMAVSQEINRKLAS